MKVSIRYKLLLYMLVSVLVFAALLFISNGFLVEKYYLEKNKNDILNTSQKIIELLDKMEYDEDEQALSASQEDVEELFRLERQRGQDFMILNENGVCFYPFYSSTVLGVESAVDSTSKGILRQETGSEVNEIYHMFPLDSTINISIDEKIDEHGKNAKPSSGSNTVEDDTIEGTQGDDLGTELDPDRMGNTERPDNEGTNKQNRTERVIKIQSALVTRPSATTGARVAGGNYYEVISTQEDGSFFALAQDDYLKINTLRYQTTHKNGLILSVSMPMSAISEGVAISNRFSTIIGIITIFVTIIWSLFISHKFSKPIEEMNDITKKMTNLDFSDQLKFKGRDEVSQLSENINILSAKLDDTIGELNQKNLKLAQDIDKERKIDKMRRDFISNVSHELKTPIFLIQGYADGLKSNISKNEEKKDFYCDVIIDEADKMNTLVKDLLDLARMESGQSELDLSNFDLYSQIISILDKYRFTFEEKRIALSEPEAANIMVHADAFKIEQVFTNYINNALEYVDEQRRIDVSIESRADGKIRVLVFNSGNNIANEELDMVWNNFYKVDEARSREIGGAGLGLSIVKAILGAHNCQYGAYNTEGGVIFWFELERSS